MTSCATCFGAIRQTRLVKAVVLTGAGGNFCSGGDVHEIIGPLTKMDARRPAEVHPHDRRPRPGDARLPAADHRRGRGRVRGRRRDPGDGERHPLRPAGRKTAFLFSRVGLSGADMGACAILPRLIGHGRAAELLFTGRAMTSDEGLAWGFYNRVVEDVMAEAHALAARDREGPQRRPCITKRQLDAEWHVSIEDALEIEAQAQARCMETNDFKRAYEAFANKQTPVFQGD